MAREVRQEGAGVINLSTAGGDNMKSPLVNGDAHTDTTTTTTGQSSQLVS